MNMIARTAKPPYVKLPNSEAKMMSDTFERFSFSESDAKTTYIIIGKKAIVNSKFG